MLQMHKVIANKQIIFEINIKFLYRILSIILLYKYNKLNFLENLFELFNINKQQIIKKKIKLRCEIKTYRTTKLC